MTMMANNSGTAVRGKWYWWIARDDKSLKCIMKCEDWDINWSLPAVGGSWIYELLTREDRDILVRAHDSGVFYEVWSELAKIRSVQYDELIRQRAEENRMTAERLIEEVRRNG